MTITNSSTRFTALAAGIAVAAALTIGAFATTSAQAAALTSTQISAIISLLQSFGASADVIANVQASLTGGTPTGGSTGGSTSGGTGAACYAWTRDLTVGSTGADVMALQQFLNTNAATMVATVGAGSPGNETMTFGPATKAAVVKFQMANGITPAAGYFGAISRARVASMCAPTTGGGDTGGSTGGSTGGLSGGEADLRNYDLISGDDLMEGDTNTEIGIAKFDVDGGDARIQRVTVEFQPTLTSASANEHPWEYIETLSLYNGSEKVGDVDAGSKSDWDSEDDDDDHSGAGTDPDFYSIDIPVDTIINEDDKAELSIRADAQSSIDEGDQDQTFVMDVPDNGIRAIDAEGIQQYTGDTTDTVTIGFDAAENGDLTVRLSSDNPAAGVLVGDDSNTSDDFDVLKFELKNSDSSDATINGIVVSVATSSAATTTGAANITSIIRRATLTLDGNDYDGDINANGTVDFDDIDATVDGDDTVEGTVTIQLFGQSGHYAATGEALTFSITSGNVDAEGADTGDASDVSGSANGKQQAIAVDGGINVEGVSMTGTQTYNSTTPANSYGDFTLKFDVTANGDDIYVPKSIQALASSTSPAAGTGVVVITDLSASSSSASVTSSLTSSADTDTNNSAFYIVRDGDTETFTVSVRIDPTATGFYQVGLDRVRFSTVDTGSSIQTLDIDQTQDEFQTDPVSISNS